MGTKRCPFCGSYIDVTAVFCSNCGSSLEGVQQPQYQQQFNQPQGQPQGQPQQMQQNQYQQNQYQQNQYQQQYQPIYTNQPQSNNMSTNKIMSIVAIALAVLGVFCGGFLFEIGAITLSIIVLSSRQYKEKDAVTLSKIALIIAAIVLVFYLIYFIFIGAVVANSIPPVDGLLEDII